MIKFYTVLLISLMGLAYAQMTGVLPSSDSGVEADWISLSLILIFFILLFSIYRYSKNSEYEYGRSRQRDAADDELSNKK